MSIEKNVQTVKNFLAALGRRDKQALLALVAEDLEWIIPGEDWPLAGTYRGHAGRWRGYFRKPTRRWRLHSLSLPSS
jgi:ketosteroid isomerase-like protein